MPDVSATALIATIAALAVGGFSKGVLGVGLPMVATPILSTFMPITDAVAVMYLPILATNLWQALTGGHLVSALRRFWPMLLVTVAMIWVGTLSLIRLDPALVAVLLGGAVALFSAFSLLNPRLRIRPGWERPIGIFAGACGGFFGGMVLIGGPAVIMYFVALHLKKEEFIGSIGLVYLTMLIPAGFSLTILGVLEARHVLPGLGSLVPVFAGLALGQWLRGKIDQDLFRKVLLSSMIIIGLNLIRRGLF